MAANPLSDLSATALSRQFLQLFCRNGLDRVSVKPQMRRNHFRRKMSDPVVEREVQDFPCLKHLHSHKISVAGIFDVMTSHGWNEADVVCVEVHGACQSDGHKHGHASLPRNVELPLRGIRMPMELAHTSWPDSVQSSDNIL